jgi:hypothetical protein
MSKTNFSLVPYHQAFVIHNLGIVTLKLGMKVCDLWKYYFHLIICRQLLNLDKSKILRYQLPADKQ